MAALQFRFSIFRVLSCISWLTLLSAFLASAVDSLPSPAGLTFGGIFYPTNSLGYALETNYTALTNGRMNYNKVYAAWNEQPWNGFVAATTNIGGYTLNTNSIIYGKRGATAISVAQFDVTVARFCLLTKRHAVTAGHWAFWVSDQAVTNWNGRTVWFIGTNNLVHGMTITNSYVGNPASTNNQMAEDRAIVIFSADVPDDVQPMRIAAPLINSMTGDIYGLVLKYFPPEAQNPYQPRAGFWVCQHGYCGRNTQVHPGGGRIGSDGGDSGSPGFIILGNECVNIGGLSMTAPSTNMLRRMDDLTRGLGLNPSNYQPGYVWLTNYPKWPY